MSNDAKCGRTKFSHPFFYSWIVLMIFMSILIYFVLMLETSVIPNIFHIASDHIVLLAGEVPPWTPGPTA